MLISCRPSFWTKIQNRGVNRAEISGLARKFFFGPALPAINILQKFYYGLNFFGGVWQKLMKIFAKHWYNL